MKRKLLLSALLLLSSAPFFAQEVSNSAVKSTTPAPATTGTSVSNPIIQPLLTKEEARERRIASIDAKLAYYTSHPEEKKAAEANGTIASLEKERADLLVQKDQAAKSNAQTPQMSAGKTQPVETVEHLNSVINAIDTKVAYVKSDQVENQKALESGWYDMMAKQRASLVSKKEALLKSQEESK